MFSLSVVQLNEVSGKYSALSYTWETGTTEAPRGFPIIVNAHRICIHYNLYCFLRSLRQTVQDEVFWADALCIDQSNTIEKNQQVRLMQHIFEQARRVRAWIGEGLNYLEQLMQFLPPERPDQSVDLGDTLTSALRSVASPPTGEELPAGSIEDRKFCAVMRDILSSHYWSRLWVVQEMVVSPTTYVSCGLQVTEWHYLHALIRAGDIFKPKRRDLWKSWHETPILQVCDSVHKGSLDFQTLIETVRHSKCTDQHDKVFGVLGIINDSGDPLFVPTGSSGLPPMYERVVDYNKSIPELYQLLTEIYVNQFPEKAGGLVAPLWRALELDLSQLTAQQLCLPVIVRALGRHERPDKRDTFPSSPCKSRFVLKLRNWHRAPTKHNLEINEIVLITRQVSSHEPPTRAEPLRVVDCVIWFPMHNNDPIENQLTRGTCTQKFIGSSIYRAPNGFWLVDITLAAIGALQKLNGAVCERLAKLGTLCMKTGGVSVETCVLQVLEDN